MNSQPEFNLLVIGKRSQTIEDIREENKKNLEHGEKMFHLIENNACVGMITYLPQNPNDLHPWIGLLIIHKEHERAGIGTLALKLLDDELAAQRIDKVRLCVQHGNHKGASFWQKNGFHKISDGLDNYNNQIDIYEKRNEEAHTMQEEDHLKVQALSDIAHLKVHGRTTGKLSPLTLFWTGSSVELNAQGSELWIEVEVNYDQYEPWISILINSMPVSRQMLTAGRYWVCIFRGMNKAAIKNVRIVKDVQAMSADSSCLLQIHAVKGDGEFAPIEAKPYRIEFIGDSITSGEGAIGARAETDWIPMWFSAVDNYTAMTAEALNAEYRVLSQSGWGVLTSWDNNPHANLPDYYEQVCGLLTGENNKALGAFDKNDFDSWQPDVVVVNLGSNDGGAFHSPEWVDTATGKAYKQRLKADGTFEDEDLMTFEEAVVRFLIKLRTYNPNAPIIWAYGMLGLPMMPAIYRAVNAYSRQTGDKQVSIFQLPNTRDETWGARQHPGKLAHAEAARELTGYLKEVLRSSSMS